MEAPVLLLLHGLGATGAVWRGWESGLARRWPGRWVAPDLAGHGGAPPLPAYTFEAFATAVDDALVLHGEADAPIVVLGHSLGGAVGLALAGRRPSVRAVIGLGVKVEWNADELSRARSLAERPVAWYDSRAEAAERFLRVAGLAGLIPPDDPAVDAGLRERDGRWRLAMDPGTFAVGTPDMAGLLTRCRAAVTLARGEHDGMNTDAQLAGLGARVVTLAGLGHNAHVEDPDATMALLDPYAGDR